MLIHLPKTKTDHRWTLGSVQQRYIFAGGGGDQFAGRACSLIDVNSTEFATLPPHFPPDIGSKGLTEEIWERILPGYNGFFPRNFKAVAPFLLASVVYHRDFLVANLPPTHPLFMQPVWSIGIIDTLRPFVEVGRLKNESARQTFPSWTWGSRIHMVPENFSFPRCSVTTLWTIWWEGTSVINAPNATSQSVLVQPLRCLQPFNLSTAADKPLLSRARKVIEECIKACITAKLVDDFPATQKKKYDHLQIAKPTNCQTLR